MTTTLTVLTLEPPGADVIVHALADLGADIELDDDTPGFLTVRDAGGELLFAVETPSLIHVPGEARRLLDRDEPGLPYWWLDLHVPAGAPPRGLPLARALADAIST